MTTWQDRYRKGSFRGVPFATQTNERSGGRRGETHEFPGRDKPWGEDLGRRAGRFSLEIFVAGPDYLDARDRLIAALDGPGPGTLVHPWDGSMSVTVPEWTCRDSTDEGGVAFFSVTFAESGAVVEAAVSVDTGALAKVAADGVITDAPEDFAGRFDVSGVASFVEDASVRLIRGTASLATIAGGLQGGVGPALRAFEAGLTLLPASAQALARSPLALAHAVVGLVQAVSILGGSSRARIAGLSMLIGQSAPVVVGSTPARIRERTNATAYIDLVTVVATAEMVRAIADAPIASYQEAVALRETAADLIEARIIATADAGNDALSQTFAELLRVMTVDVTARGGTLARVYAYVPAQAEPALVIAARLYGPQAALIDRAADIVARNAIAHPGFVAGGQPVEVLEVSGG